MFIFFRLKCIVKQLLDSVFEMYSKTIIGFGFCDLQNHQSLGISGLSASPSAISPYVDINKSAYHKNRIQ